MFCKQKSLKFQNNLHGTQLIWFLMDDIANRPTHRPTSQVLCRRFIRITIQRFINFKWNDLTWRCIGQSWKNIDNTSKTAVFRARLKKATQEVIMLRYINNHWMKRFKIVNSLVLKTRLDAWQVNVNWRVSLSYWCNYNLRTR